MANIFQRAWNDVTGWLNTPQGRRLSADAVTPDDQPRYFPDQRTKLPTGAVTGAPTGPWVYPTTMTPAGRVTGDPGDAFRGPPAAPETPRYFPASRVRGGQPMPPRDMVWNPNAPSPSRPLPGGTVWNPNAPAPSPGGSPWDYSTGQETLPATNIDPSQFGRGLTPQGGGPSMSPGPTTPNVPATVPSPQPGGVPNIDVTGSYGGVVPTQVPPGSARMPTVGVGPENVDVTASTAGALPTREMPRNVAGWSPMYGPLAAPNVTAPSTGSTTPNIAQTTPAQPQSQPLGANQGFEGEYSSGIPAPVEQETKVTHADGSSTHVKHTTAQAAAQKQANRQQQAGGGQPAQGGGQGGGQPAQGGGQRGGMAGLGTGAYNAPAGSTAPTVGSAMGQAPQQGGGLGGPSGPQGAAGPGQTTTLQVPAHPGLLQRIGQTIGHFFSGTLGQWAPQQGQTINLGTLPNQTQGNALSGVHQALAQGRHHIASNRGGTAPASAPPPPFPYQTNPEIGTWEAAGGLPPYGTTTFPNAADPGLLRAGGTMPPPSQFNLASGYQ